MKNCNCDNFNSRFLGLRDFCIQQFPFIAEDFDALTTYELLEKVVCYLKKIGKYTEEMGQKFKDLFDYVNGYFDNLDVESVINQIIQNMYDGGLITEAIDNILTQTEEKCRKLVYVNCYGAKGDGVTDDTEAIQNCIKNNDNCIYIFHGRYRITDTIVIPHGTRTLNLANMEWDGGQNKPMFRTEIIGQEYRQGGVTFFGGCITGKINNNTSNLDCGIMIDTYTTRISNVRIADYEKYGILIAHTFEDWNFGDNKSTNTQIENCEITNFPRITGCAIAAVHTDNMVSNCNINGAEFGIGYYGGNLFISNTHITPTTSAYTPDYGYFVDFSKNISGVGSKMVLSFTGCYFNGMPYYFFNNTSNFSHDILISGGAIILASNVPDNFQYNFFRNNEYVVNLECKNVLLRAPQTTPVYMFSQYTASVQTIRIARPEIIPIYGSNVNNCEFDIRNCVNSYSGQSVPVVTTSNPINANTARLIGHMVIRGNSGSCNLKLFRPTSLSEVKLTTSTGDRTNVFGDTEFQILVEKQVRSRIINGIDISYKRIFLYNPTNAPVNDFTTIGGDDTYPFKQLFLYPVYTNTDEIPNLENCDIY